MPAKLGHKPRIIPAIYVKPFVKGQKDDNNDAEALRLVSRAPRLHRNKLATALANKLARIAWSILHNEKAFDTPPFEMIAI